MRCLLSWLRWKLFDYLQRKWPVEKPSEQELISYGREQERQKPEVLHLLPGEWTKQYKLTQSDTRRIEAINAETARELQRHLDERRHLSGPYEPPEKRTDAISSFEIEKAILHGYHLLPVRTQEMQAAFPVADTDKFLI